MASLEKKKNGKKDYLINRKAVRSPVPPGVVLFSRRRVFQHDGTEQNYTWIISIERISVHIRREQCNFMRLYTSYIIIRDARDAMTRER